MSDEIEAAHNIDRLRELIRRLERIGSDPSRRQLSEALLAQAVDLETAWEDDHCMNVMSNGSPCGDPLLDGECRRCAVSS